MRTLNRPMFRTGGSAGTGITSGLAPRQGYENGKMVQDAREKEALLRSMVKQKPDHSMARGLMEWGLNMASNPPSGSILNTAAEQAKEPFAKYQKSKGERSAFDQQIAMAAATSAMSQSDKMKQLSMKDPASMIDAQKKARIMWNNRRTETNPSGNYNTDTDENWKSYEEVESWVVNKSIYSKSGMYNPEVEKGIDIEKRTEYLMDGNLPDAYDNPTQSAEIAEIGYNVSNDEMYKDIKNKFDYNIYVINPDEFGEKDINTGGHQRTDAGNEGSDYVHNKVYYNYEDSQFYTFNSAGVGSFHLVTLDTNNMEQ